MTYFVCEDTFDGVLCAVYDAWASGLGHANVHVQIEADMEYQMFCEYRTVPTDSEKAEKVIRSVRRKISEEAYQMIYESYLSCENDRADMVYRFLVDGFRYGSGITRMLNLDSVFQVFSLCRYIRNEAHKMKEFVRFEELDTGILFSSVHPKNNAIYLVAPHFADRLPDENWIIYDRNRRLAAVHEAGKGWLMVKTDTPLDQTLKRAREEKGYQDLWKVFFKTIAIKERINPRCQRNFLPLHYRDVMTEFQ